MTPTRKRRLIFVALVLLAVGAATTLALTAFQDNMLWYRSPTEIKEGKAPIGKSFRAGGMVLEGSVKRDPESLYVEFVVSDGGTNLKIEYDGILPDLFREGQGIIAEGKINDEGIFEADNVLAKHDENYMPPEVAASMIMPPATGEAAENNGETEQ